MIRPASAASCAALVVSVVSNLLIVRFYDLAFTGFWDRLFFVAGVASLIALFAGSSVWLLERICVSWSVSESRCASWLRSASVASILALNMALWVDSFLTGSLRLIGLGVAAIPLLVGVAVGMKPRDAERRKPSVATGSAGVATLTGVVLLCWALGSWLHDEGDSATAEIPPEVASSGQELPLNTNLLFVVVDTLRADHLGYEGYVRYTSPTLDRLARQGVTFRGATAQATRTSPSMASLLTGATPLTHRIIESRSVLGSDLPTLGKLLDQAGYDTGAIVGNPMVGSSFGYGEGFEHFDEVFRESGESVDASVIVDRAISWLRGERGIPFALWLHFVDPHTPYDPPEPWHREFFGDELYESQASDVLPVGGRIGAMPVSARVEGYSSLRDYIALYDGEIRYTDAEIGRLLDSLEEIGRFDDTLIVLTSDHGESLGDHNYFFSHGDYSYESTSRVPLVFAHPQLEPPHSHPPVPRLIDVVPSVVDLLGLDRSGRFEGLSLFSDSPRVGLDVSAPVLSGSADYTNLGVRTSGHKLILSPRHWRGFDVLARWKLTIWPTRAKESRYLRRSYRVELYDLVDDPHETTNLAGLLPDRQEQLMTLLLDWIRRDRSSSLDAEQRSREELDLEVERQLEALGYLD